jgi:GTPase SAR1 family protein
MGMAKNPDMVMLVFDCTNEKSFKNAFKLLEKVKKLNNKSNFPGVLVSSKCEHKTAK